MTQSENIAELAKALAAKERQEQRAFELARELVEMRVEKERAYKRRSKAAKRGWKKRRQGSG